MAANGSGPMVFNDDMTADKSSKMNSEVSDLNPNGHAFPLLKTKPRAEKPTNKHGAHLNHIHYSSNEAINCCGTKI